MPDNKKNSILYKHYKNKLYKYLGSVYHSESLEELVLYECRYQNDISKLWVRPKEMFFNHLSIDDKKIRRFEPLDLHYEIKNHLSVDDKKAICQISSDFFDKLNIEKLNSRLTKKPKHVLVASYYDNKMLAFKLAYEKDNETFYSWLGAVSKNYQGLGIGRELLLTLESWCKENGYKKITTKTMNRYKAMLILNLKNGFKITKTETSKTGKLKIIMNKTLID